jgi:hypothetical protein
MAARRSIVRVTANFEVNLDAIELFLAKAGAVSTFKRLLDDLTQQVIPALESYPDIGRPFLARPVYSVEVRQRIKQLERQFDAANLREYVAGDFLILYSTQGTSVYLLSVKHHRQLSFDLAAYWQSM